MKSSSRVPDSFPPRTGPVIVHPGLDPDLSVPPYNLCDHILGPARRLDSHGPTLNQNVRIDQAIDELAKRFQPVWITQSPLSCRLSPKTEALIWMRFLDGAGRTKGALKVMIALNLHSSQQLLPVITNAILTLLRYLGAENVYVLETIWMGVDRIKLLSEYRNQALLAFDNADRALDGLSNLVFINDVFLCAQDILELLWQRRFQGADSACGTDWWEAKTLREQYGSQTPRRPTTPARTPAYAEAACAPIDFPIAPTLAIPMALEKAGLEFKDMTKIEINEAFPVVALASMKILGIKAEKVNVNGGAVALGHPIGSSCCWIVVSLINSLKPGEYGVAGVCNGGGAASAMVIQRL
ncbi:hypothetical protein PtA15_10A401 [Puccinia triticina]|uniref:Thiolase C-terminal domain-containing protein n=1 Tax=Puccinia triticina TaxID=208348 RepID=A0ABY7CXA0_9BASI|nr:uncharacterized protein PtA15_10A401 [Puccinia triticina]WAQ88978.1 hypothetical protein PtA15_10A401 [Puccinia triticina]